MCRGAGASDTAGMKLNALPFLLLPGVVLIGSLFGGWAGTQGALTIWFSFVLIGTVLNIAHHLFDRLIELPSSRRPTLSGR